MTGKRARVLYLPNESGDLSQRGPRYALGALLDAGLIEGVRIVSLLHRVRVGDDSVERARVVEIVRDFKPTIILLDMPRGTCLRSSDVEAWRSLSDFAFVILDMDPYHWWFKPLSREAKALAPCADRVFLPGSGSFLGYYRRAGASDVRCTRHTYPPCSFGRLEITGDTVTRDVVMVANRIPSRLGRLRTIPGQLDRRRLVASLEHEFGGGFAVFGGGWTEPAGLGPVPFFEQESAIRSAWVTANWDNFPAEPDYYSNRLPISFASGSVHFTTWHPGLDELFGELPFLRLVRRQSDMAPAIRAYLDSTSPVERIDHARQARAFADSRYRQDDWLVEILNSGGAEIEPAVAKDAFRGGSRMLTEE